MKSKLAGLVAAIISTAVCAIAVARDDGSHSTTSTNVNYPTITANSVQVLMIPDDTRANSKKLIRAIVPSDDAVIGWRHNIITGTGIKYFSSRNKFTAKTITIENLASSVDAVTSSNRSFSAAGGLSAEAASSPTSGTCITPNPCSFSARNGQLYNNGLPVPGNVFTIMNPNGTVDSTVTVSPGDPNATTTAGPPGQPDPNNPTNPRKKDPGAPDDDDDDDDDG
jgi:hypothetical protein